MNNIRLMRERSGKSLRGLANEAEISPPYLLDLERGARGAKTETLMRIAAALDCSVADLVGNADDTTDRESA